MRGRNRNARVLLGGERFGRWTAISTSPNRVHCVCDCGTVRSVDRKSLFTSNSRSCGCLNREQAARRAALRSTTHGHASGGQSPTYRTWVSMRQRCLEPRNASYPYYGGRGISVCDRWRDDFAAFLADMGERPAGTSIDRIDVNGDYVPDNCRWATADQQAQNSRTTKLGPVSVALIRCMSARGSASRDLAHAFGVSSSTIDGVVARRTWRTL